MTTEEITEKEAAIAKAEVRLKDLIDSVENGKKTLQKN